MSVCISALLPNADLLVPDFPSNRFSNDDPQGFAEDLVRAIDEVAVNNVGHIRYADITMIGHSVGALIVRKAYVFACGQTQDRIRSIPKLETPWLRAVRRIVLLAGMNRGLSVSPKPRDMSWQKCLAIRLATEVVRMFGVARFALSIRRG